jgi:hypothetical protein
MLNKGTVALFSIIYYYITIINKMIKFISDQNTD